MKPIKFIDNLSFSPDGELVSAGSSYRGSAIFMRQGDLDIRLDYGSRIKYKSHDYSTFRNCNVDEILIKR
jgi:hypothetical protein